MKRIVIFVIISLRYLLTGIISLGIHGVSKGDALESQPNIIASPLLNEAILDDGYGEIPFIVQNKTTNTINIRGFHGRAAVLMTLNDLGERTTVARFSEQDSVPYSANQNTPVLLRPGETGTFNCPFSMETLAFVAARNHKIFGAIPYENVGTKQRFICYSALFQVPADLAKPPWVDLGAQSYLAVIPDIAKIVFQGDFVLIPVTITNTTSKPYLPNSGFALFSLARSGTNREGPSPWETYKDAGPVLKPGDSVEVEGRSYTTITILKAEGYRQGDKVFAAVGGRVPNTNEVFECYSAPFELPPFPKPSSPK